VVLSPEASGDLSRSKWFFSRSKWWSFRKQVILSPEAIGVFLGSKWFSLQKQVVTFLVARGSLSRSKKCSFW
jgi:hypothetical protein